MFSALGDATRRDILRRAASGEHSVSGLARHYPVSFAAVQKHVAGAGAGGLVVKRRQGREHLVSTDVTTVRHAREQLEILEALWRDRLDRFGDVLAELPTTALPEQPGIPGGSMTVTDVVRDRANRTLTLTAEYPAAPEQVWQLWADPRLLERWWGPPSYPATVVEHDLRPGGKVTYYMTSPEGERYHGYWTVEAVDSARGLEFEDGFADAEGTPSGTMPTSRSLVRIEAWTPARRG